LVGDSRGYAMVSRLSAVHLTTEEDLAISSKRQGERTRLQRAGGVRRPQTVQHGPTASHEEFIHGVRAIVAVRAPRMYGPRSSGLPSRLTACRRSGPSGQSLPGSNSAPVRWGAARGEGGRVAPVGARGSVCGNAPASRPSRRPWRLTTSQQPVTDATVRLSARGEGARAVTFADSQPIKGAGRQHGAGLAYFTVPGRFPAGPAPPPPVTGRRLDVVQTVTAVPRTRNVRHSATRLQIPSGTPPPLYTLSLRLFDRARPGR
jgi:hypothetical protein